VYDHGCRAAKFDLVVNTRITGRLLKIGGKLYECIAVERTLNARPTIHVGETIGLLLKDVG
jgi:hypothetical protein